MHFHSYIQMFGIILAAYVIGSIPTGYILVKAIKGMDIREHGSGSTGATNVRRVLGKWGFLTVTLIDFLKGMLPVIAAKYLEIRYNLLSQYSILPVLVSVAVIVGHSKSVFLNFSGGKSVASGVGTIFGLCPPVGLITALLWCIITYTTKIISISSIIVMLLTPVWMILFRQPVSYFVYCLAGSLYISLFLHRDNIKRLLSGTENKVK